MFAKTCFAGPVNGACFSSHSTEEPIVSFRVNFFPKNPGTDKWRIKIRGSLSDQRFGLGGLCRSLLKCPSLEKLC